MTLAARLYEAHRRALEDPTSRPAWGNATTEERRAWEAAATAVELLRPECQPWCAVCATARGTSAPMIGDVVELAIAPEPNAAPAGSWAGMQPHAISEPEHRFACKDCNETVVVEAVRCSRCVDKGAVPR